jgi:hypothetical protein
VRSSAIDGETVPTTVKPVHETPEVQDAEEVATVPNCAAPVQYVRLPRFGVAEVANWLFKVIVEPRATEPPPERPVPARTVREEFWSDVLGTFETVRAPEEFERPVPVSELNDEPLMTKLVVDAVVNDAYVVDEYANV